LGFEAEIDRTYVSQIERSIINPSLLILHRVARALKTNVPALLLKTPTPKDDTTPKSATT
jgi:transcriptional regulator with XRE-family HTH domain